MANTSISLGPALEKFANAQVASGRYGSVSEVVREGLRILEEREFKLKALRDAWDEGVNSGRSKRSLAEIRAELGA